MAIKSQRGEKTGQGSAKDKKKPPPLKAVIRRLPPDMTLKEFGEQVSPLPEHDYLAFVPADLGLGQYAFSRAYINFVSQEDIVTFRDRFDGYVFVDKQGFEFPAVVEYAPCQRLPRFRTRKPDTKAGTIEEDADYKAFLEAAEAKQEPSLGWEAALEEIEKRQLEAKENVSATPLVTFVCKRRAEKKEERRRRELERRKEETRTAKLKTYKDKPRDKDRGDAKEPPKGIWGDDKESKHELVYTSKKYEDSVKEKPRKDSLGRKDFRSEKEDRFGKRKDKTDKWKEADKTKYDDKAKREKEVRSKDSDLDEKKKKGDKKARPPGASRDLTDERGGESGSQSGTRPAAEGAKSSERTGSSEKLADTQKAASSSHSSEAKQRRDAKTSDRKIRNKDRPDLAIYRPGMGKYSSRRLQERDSQSASPPPAASGGESGGAAEGDTSARRTLVFRRSRAANAAE